MRAQLPEATIELIDFSRWPVPAGTVEFPLSGLRQGYWRGSVLYGGSQRFAIWAQVKLRVAARRVVAAQDLAAGRPIEPSALRLESFDVTPGAGLYPGSIAEAAGKLPRRGIPAGIAIRSEWLELPPLVARGETVKVEVRSGAAVIQLDGRALAAGAAGQSIPVLNPATGKNFRARIQGPGHVLVESLP
jgi:flagella basal body P-ring formation protein FlgA